MVRLLIGGALGAAVLAFVIFGAIRLRPPTYGVLFANLPADEANGVLTKLDAAKIPHQLSPDGSTISVPVEFVAQERVALAGEGIVKGGSTGYELFDRTNLGMTDTQEKIAKIRATEGELQRTISGLTPVETARVHIAAPETSLYSTSQAPTTASVAVHTKSGLSLSPQEVRGIIQLVAGAVENLKPENVTIVNQDGTVLLAAPNLGQDGGQSTAKLSNEQLVAKQKYEENLQGNIQGLLDAAIGLKRSAVRVATEMNFDQTQTETKSYSPAGTVRSSQTERENYSGTGSQRPPASGVTGTTSNTVPTYQGTGQQGPSNYTKSKSTTNFEVGEITSKHVDSPGKVTRVSVAVLVNVPGNAAQPQNGQPQYALAAADVAKIRNVVAAAAGIDPARGDVVSVEAIPFAPPAEVPVRVVTTGVLGIPLPVLIVLGVLLAMVGAGAFFATNVRRKAAARTTTVDLPSFDSALADELPSFEEHPMLEGTPVIAAPIRSAADLTREQMIEYVTTVAQETPDSLAKLIKLWLAE